MATRRSKGDGIKSTTDAISDMATGLQTSPDFEPTDVIDIIPPTFVKMIVLEVISDPNRELKNEARKEDLQELGVTNISLVENLPRNTIVAQRVGQDVPPMFVFPFFPSHIAMPCKPGECVWVMIEKPGAAQLEIAYWFSRVVEPHVADDVNHSHPNRSTEISMVPGSKERAEREKRGTSETGEDIWHEMRNGPVIKIGDDRVTVAEAPILAGQPENVFERLIQLTKASRHVQYESVPRFRKRPGDLVLEGSNNTLIVLGLERSGSIDMPAGISNLNNAGAIDIVVGRGQTKETSGKTASTTAIFDAKGKQKGSELKKELNKSLDMLEDREGDTDLKNDRSRIFISQKSPVDRNFGVDKYNTQRNMSVLDHPDGEPGIVIKSDKVRLIARSDVQFIVTGFDTKIVDDNTKSIKDEKNVLTEGKKTRVNWASITIKSNGDIVFTPSDDGYIRLGGPDANLGVVCSDLPVDTVNGGVSGKALKTTMGGAFAGSVADPDGKSNKRALGASGQAKFANKVLIK